MDQALIGKLAGVIAAGAFVPYIISILKGKTKPQRATFAIWSAVSIVGLVSYIASGATDTIWVIWAYTILGFIVFLLSFKYGTGGFNKLDVICLVGAGMGIVLWIWTNNPGYALYISIFCELLGWMPTFKKMYIDPESEDLLAWSIALFAASLNVIAITSWKPDIAIYPLYIVITDLAAVTILLARRKHYRRV